MYSSCFTMTQVQSESRVHVQHEQQLLVIDVAGYENENDGPRA